MEKLLAAPPRDPAAQLPKPPRPISITYPFSTDEMLREHVGAWQGRGSVLCAHGTAALAALAADPAELPIVTGFGCPSWKGDRAGQSGGPISGACSHAVARMLVPTFLLCPLRLLCTQYRSPWEEVRIGRILEDLDSLAGYVAFDHRCGLKEIEFVTLALSTDLL